MYKLIIGLVLLAVSASANAIPVYLTGLVAVSGGGTVITTISDGSHISGIAPASTAVWDWDSTSLILSSTGIYSSVLSIGGSPLSATILADVITDLSIATLAGTASATSYECIEGTFLANVGANGCGMYTFGLNAVDDSTTEWGAAPLFTSPGTDVTQTLSSDDASSGPPRDISAFDMSLTSWDGTTLVIDNFTFTGKGGDPEPTGGGSITLSTINPVPVPAAVYLFGSALGLLGWMRRSRRTLSSA